MPQSNNPDNLLTSAHAALDHSGIPGVGAVVDGITESVQTQQPIGTAISRVVPGGTLDADLQCLEFELWGRNTSGGSADTLTLQFGATVLLSRSIPLTNQFVVRGKIVRTGPAAQLAFAEINVGSASTAGTGVQRTQPTETLANPLTLQASDASGLLQFDALVVRKWLEP